ncbi:MAG TPA: L,D-transpeptidase [Dehalococcoidia bacterium]|nr:L,D-transpeptidase [Dehalococcoidia bacterium]
MRQPGLRARIDRRRFLSSIPVFAGAGLALAASLRGARADDDPNDIITVPIPANIAPGEHWVDVNLSQQAACAMSGGEIVRVVLVTTGMPGWETPRGQFRILYRVADETMTSAGIGIPIDSPDGYDLDHVLWTQYFTNEGHALHDNYWRPLSVFGRTPTSHGCVGMVESDAHFMWSWVGVGDLVNIHA